MTLKVDTITNVAGTGAPNIPDGMSIAGTALASVNQMEYTSSGSEPTSPADGALWWDSGSALFKMYVNDAWYEVTTTPPPPAFLAGDRAVIAGGEGTTTNQGRIDYYSIATPGNATQFGTLSATYRGRRIASASNGTRGIFAGGYGNGMINAISYITISTTSASTDFGDLTASREGATGVYDATRACFGGGYTGINTFPNYGYDGNIDYITMATTGNATSFGNLVEKKGMSAGIASETRGVWIAGRLKSNGKTNGIDYITIQTTGNSTDFGDATSSGGDLGGCSDGTYGLGFGSDTDTNAIQYITIATTGNSTDFGDLSVARTGPAGAGNASRATFSGGGGYSGSNVIDYASFTTPANAVDFGDLTLTRGYSCGLSGA